MENLEIFQKNLEKKIRYFTDKNYRDLMLKWMKYNPQDLANAIKGNQVLMQGIEDVSLRVKLTGELNHGLGTTFHMGLQLGYFLALELMDTSNETKN